ncbi:unnamed protein product [Polarella glacialis]|uniref:Uncharacterized protein n=1 Tax=Polarella glacialis TaxID=89957 RepID=A0A813DHJ2_POLGL|nr:unnamed protein product [Polarella glacialis]
MGCQASSIPGYGTQVIVVGESQGRRSSSLSKRQGSGGFSAGAAQAAASRRAPSASRGSPSSGRRRGRGSMSFLDGLFDMVEQDIQHIRDGPPIFLRRSA